VNSEGIPSRQINLTDQCRDEDGEKHEHYGYHEDSCFAPLHLDASRGECFGSHGYSSMQADEEQHEGQFDMQPWRMKIVARVGHNQAGAGQDRQQGSGIGQAPQVDALQARQRLAGFRRGLLRVTRKRHGRHQQAAYPKHQTQNMSDKKSWNHGDHPRRSLTGC
jgi:hypothetical protein